MDYLALGWFLLTLVYAGLYLKHESEERERRDTYLLHILQQWSNLYLKLAQAQEENARLLKQRQELQVLMQNWQQVGAQTPMGRCAIEVQAILNAK